MCPCLLDQSTSVCIADIHVTNKDYTFMRKDLQVFVSLLYRAFCVNFFVLLQKTAGVHLLLNAS